MGLLKSANNVQGVDLVDFRDQLYYNKYEYRARVTVPGLRRGYYWSPDEFEHRFNTGKLWGKPNKDETVIIKENLTDIKACLQFRDDHKKDKTVTIRMEGNTMAVFHNDLDFLHKTFDGIVGATVDYTQAETSSFAGIKTFVNEPKHKFRVYFRSKRVPEDFRESVTKILEANKNLRPGPAFKEWLKQTSPPSWRSWYHNYLSANYFIDYNEESYLSYFSLMHGDHLGKKYKLEKRADTV
jgi:hypothetical protein